MLYYIIEICIPNDREYYADQQKEQSCKKNTVVARFFYNRELSFSVLCVNLVVFSTHRDKCKHYVSKYKAYSYKRSFSADKQKSGKQGK